MFGETLKKERKRASKTLRELAESTGLTVGNISDMEHGRRRPPKEGVLKEMESFLKVRSHKLLRAALKEWNVPSRYTQRPAPTMDLLRATEDLDESEVAELIRDFKARRTGAKEKKG